MFVCLLACLFVFRPLFSSLLEALPKKTWNLRDDTYECREAEYIAEVEGSLLHAKGLMIVHLFQYFLRARTSLREDKMNQVWVITEHNVRGISCLS